MGHFTFRWDQKLRRNVSTVTNHRGARHYSLHNVIADVIADISVCLYLLFMNKRKSEVIFVHLNLISYRLRYLVLAESTGELVSFEFSDRLVRSLVSAKRSANRWVQTKKWLHFLADLWSQSEFRTLRKTNPKSEMSMSQYPKTGSADLHLRSINSFVASSQHLQRGIMFSLCPSRCPSRCCPVPTIALTVRQQAVRAGQSIPAPTWTRPHSRAKMK